ncbi:MAG TPA: acyltransferase [Candidatus Acidoferrales bacterium]|jgi:peptidoglycan/LPS O-acetylase OafA/YrhL|nr:acyltransferase [Candidatus Acidoferrales bacterium]
MTSTECVKLRELKGRVPEIDGLRGIAIGMVVMWHFFTETAQSRPGSGLAYLTRSLSLTWTGVDLFFVLSGFLIGGILVDTCDATNYFRAFYTRRFFRIVPIYAIVLLLFPAMHFLRHPAGPNIAAGAETSPPWYMYWTFTQNLWMAASSSLGTNSLDMSWSLAVEEQFYLTIPLVILLFRGRQLRKIVVAGILAAPLLRLVLYFVWHTKAGVAAYVLMPCRADGLLLGILAASLLRDTAWKKRIQNANRFFIVAASILLAGVAYLASRAATFSDPLMFTVGYTWMACFYVIVLVFAVTRPETMVARALRVGWLRWLGSIAYGTYLLHQAVLRVVFRIFSVDPPRITSIRSLIIAIFAVAVTLTVAYLSWIYFEKPLVRIGHRTNYEFDRPSAVSPDLVTQRSDGGETMKEAGATATT